MPLLLAKRRHWIRFVFLVGLSLCLAISPVTLTNHRGNLATASQTERASQLVQQGLESYQRSAFESAIASWRQALDLYQNSNDNVSVAIAQENLARAYQQLGQSDHAIQAWRSLLSLHRQLDNPSKVGQIRTELAQTYLDVGQSRQAIAILCNPINPKTLDAEPIQCTEGSALSIAQTFSDRPGEIAALGTLGNAYQAQGNYLQAIQWLQQGLTLATGPEFQAQRSNLLNSLGYAYASDAKVQARRKRTGLQSEYEANALKYFEQSLAIAQNQQDATGTIRALLNLIPLYEQQTGDTIKADQARQQALDLLPQLPASRDTVFTTIDVAQRFRTLKTDRMLAVSCYSNDHAGQVQDILNRSVALAKQLGDRRAESFALGELGHLYECRQDYPKALELTQQARWAAEGIQGQDSLYLWEWQIGRILQAQNKPKAAIPYFERAVETLDAIRSDIVSANRDLRFDFRDTIEPIYRDLALLRLSLEEPTTSVRTSKSSPANISAVLKTMDSLKLAELQNFFGDDCILATLPKTRIEEITEDTQSAVISTIIFEDRTAVVLGLPGDRYNIAWVEASEGEIRKTVNDYRKGLQDPGLTSERRPSQQLFSWLIHPFEETLRHENIETLVFVQDGIFRTVPMAALHDGKQFLVERYSVATTPSIRLTSPRALNQQKLSAMILGLSKEVQIEGEPGFFPALKFVDEEVNFVNEVLPNSQILRNENFNRDRLEQALTKQSYPIVHVATHAEFGPSPEDTFLVTGDNKKLAINEFDTLIRQVTGPSNPIELLVLSACKSATGDDRAALGLAGVAIQAGARSSVASLWYITDDSTAAFIQLFYQELLKPNTSKAQAMRKAQLNMLNGSQFSDPNAWAPFILIGNWL